MLWQVSLIRYAWRLSTFDPSNEFIYFVDICWRAQKEGGTEGPGSWPRSFGPRSFRKSTAWRILCCALQKRTICYQKMAPFYVQIQMLWALRLLHGGSRWHVWQRNGMCLVVVGVYDWGPCVPGPDPFIHRPFPCVGNLTVFNKAVVFGVDGTLLAVHHKHHMAHTLTPTENISVRRAVTKNSDHILYYIMLYYIIWYYIILYYIILFAVK